VAEAIRKSKSYCLKSPKHPLDHFWRFEEQLRRRFGAFSLATGLVRGVYTDPDTHRLVSDMSREYTIALSEDRLDELRRMLAEEVAPLFVQKCIYLSVGGQAELVINANLRDD